MDDLERYIDWAVSVVLSAPGRDAATCRPGVELSTRNRRPYG
ncbi:hypothetical protein [Paraburkholderia sp. J63]|nr:hypothetical protein [Paraburkholderia sp. J63]